MRQLKESSDECYEETLRTVDRRDQAGDPSFSEAQQHILADRRDFVRRMARFGRDAGIDGRSFLPWVFDSAGSL